jgi:RNA-binding protein YlmH
MIEKEDKFLLGQLQDQIRHCLEDGIPSNTGFLDHRQAGLVEGVCRKYPGLRYQMDGGYEEGERKICRMTPEGQEEQVLLSALRIHKKGLKELTHRDYLGSLLALGIKRNQVGDILVREDGADVLILKELGPFFCSSLDKVGNQPVHGEIRELSELHVVESPREEVPMTVSSLRLDNLTAAAFRVSRGDAAEAIRQGLIFVNGLSQSKPDRNLQPGDKLVFRGKGKIILSDILGNTKKDKIAVVIQIFKG